MLSTSTSVLMTYMGFPDTVPPFSGLSALGSAGFMGVHVYPLFFPFFFSVSFPFCSPVFLRVFSVTFAVLSFCAAFLVLPARWSP